MCLFNRLSLKNSSTDAWTTKTNTSFLEFVYGFTAVQLKARDLHTVRYCRSPIVNAVVGKRFLYLLSKSWSGVYLFGGVRYNYGYNAKVFIMDDTGLWLPYPQDLQAWLWSILKRFWLACYMYLLSRLESKRFLHRTLSIGDYFIHIGGNEGYKKLEIWEFKVRKSINQLLWTSLSAELLSSLN